MVPVFIASLAGNEYLDQKQQDQSKKTASFLHALSFVLGFTLVFTMLGAVAGLTGHMISPTSLAVRYLSGSILVLLGLYMLLAARFPQLNFEKRINLSIAKGGYFRSFLTGVVFTFAWTPCISPILGSILTLSLASDTVWRGTGLLLVYSLGMGLPFLLIGLAAEILLPVVRRLNRFTIIFYAIGGLVLVTIGLLILFGKLSLLSV
jgi:cytochrome c-type biogenesis protein